MRTAAVNPFDTATFVGAMSGALNEAFSDIRGTSGGVSAREQIEKTLYRAFAQLMPGTTNFAARTITLRAAQDVCGLNCARSTPSETPGPPWGIS
jgi:Zn-dependent metalloprotease